MTEPLLLPKQTAEPWRFFSWTPTSAARANDAELALLSQHLDVRLTGAEQPHTTVQSSEAVTAASRPSAELGLVQVAPDQFINTLVIEPFWKRLQTQRASQVAAAAAQAADPGSPDADMSEVGGIDHLIAAQHAHWRQQQQRDGTASPSGQSSGQPNGQSNSQPNDQPIRNLVIAHGYGAGLGFFYKNFAAISRVPGYRVFAIDWLGMANSSRPPFPHKSRRQTDEEIVETSERFFVDSLEEWRKKMGLETMVLAGHSLGGYLSRVDKLLLLSPVGVPEPPPKEQQAPQRSMLMSVFRSMWEMNMTPMSVVRTVGPLGPSLVRQYTSRRFAHMDPAEVATIEKYIYHTSAQPGSGEFALARLLLPGAWARLPLHPRLTKLTMPTTFIYGTHDWMDHRHAMRSVPHMPVDTRVSLVKNAGHHLYFDNPTGLSNAVMAEMLDVKPGPYSVPDVEYVYLRA
ncbi:Alpha/Beta hydrolase protein [Entophlyctis helioformis]|nr:Alpha/Beta hydrolase protein [Entophlyctis helioformis]